MKRETEREKTDYSFKKLVCNKVGRVRVREGLRVGQERITSKDET